jgi:hypothetical protein
VLHAAGKICINQEHSEIGSNARGKKTKIFIVKTFSILVEVLLPQKLLLILRKKLKVLLGIVFSILMPNIFYARSRTPLS